MSDNRKTAAALLAKAHNTVTKDRPGIHGSAENSFQMIADLWTVYLRHAIIARDGDAKITTVDVAQMMSMLKKARAMYGDVFNDDNFIDDIGYTSLAGMLQLPDPDKTPVDENSGHNVVFGGNPGHNHSFGGEEDSYGFQSCVIEGCAAKRQVRKRRATPAEAAS